MSNEAQGGTLHDGILKGHHATRSQTDVSMISQVSSRTRSRCEVGDRLKKRVQTSKLSKRIANYAIEHDMVQLPESQPGALFGVPNDSHSRESWNAMLNEMVEFARHNVPKGEKPVLLPPDPSATRTAPAILDRDRSMTAAEDRRVPWGPDDIKGYVHPKGSGKVSQDRDSELFLFHPSSKTAASNTRRNISEPTIVNISKSFQHDRCHPTVLDPRKTRTHDGIPAPQLQVHETPELFLRRTKPIRHPNALLAGKKCDNSKEPVTSSLLPDHIPRSRHTLLTNVNLVGLSANGGLLNRVAQSAATSHSPANASDSVESQDFHAGHEHTSKSRYNTTKTKDELTMVTKQDSQHKILPMKTRQAEDLGLFSQSDRTVSSSRANVISSLVSQPSASEEKNSELHKVEALLETQLGDNAKKNNEKSSDSKALSSTTDIYTRREQKSNFSHTRLPVSTSAADLPNVTPTGVWNSLLEIWEEKRFEAAESAAQQHRKSLYTDGPSQRRFKVHDTRETRTEPSVLPSHQHKRLVPDDIIDPASSQTGLTSRSTGTSKMKPLPLLPSKMTVQKGVNFYKHPNAPSASMDVTIQGNSDTSTAPQKVTRMISRPRPSTGATSKRFVDQDYIDPAQELATTRKERRDKNSDSKVTSSDAQNRATQVQTLETKKIMPEGLTTSTTTEVDAERRRKKLMEHKARLDEKRMRRRFELAGMAPSSTTALLAGIE